MSDEMLTNPSTGGTTQTEEFRPLEGAPATQERVQPAQVPSIGRLVHYVLGEESRNAGEHRPAVVVRVWDQSGPERRLNLQIFTDEQNDGWAAGTRWATSVKFDPAGSLGTWHWPEYVAPA